MPKGTIVISWLYVSDYHYKRYHAVYQSYSDIQGIIHYRASKNGRDEAKELVILIHTY